MTNPIETGEADNTAFMCEVAATLAVAPPTIDARASTPVRTIIYSQYLCQKNPGFFFLIAFAGPWSIGSSSAMELCHGESSGAATTILKESHCPMLGKRVSSLLRGSFWGSPHNVLRGSSNNCGDIMTRNSSSVSDQTAQECLVIIKRSAQSMS